MAFYHQRHRAASRSPTRATVTKLSDRGTFQTIGLVTDVEPFLRVLVDELEAAEV